MDERIDIDGACAELQRIDKLLTSAKTDEERVFIYMRILNTGQQLVQHAGTLANQLTGKCVDRLDAKVIS